jgi:hypothetical protein
MKPGRRPKMSVSFPLNGCTVVIAMRYAEPSHDMMANEWNSDATAEDNVEVIELSVSVRRQFNRHMKQATYLLLQEKMRAT